MLGVTMIGQFLGLISFGLLCVFSLLYLSSAIPKKPPAVEKALAFIKLHLNYFALAGVIYGFAAFCLSIIMVPVPLNKVVGMGAAVLLIVMALPFTFDRLIGVHEAKINAAIMKELRNGVGVISQNEVVLGIVGALVAVALFVTVVAPAAG
jgi:hypothetical protein